MSDKEYSFYKNNFQKSLSKQLNLQLTVTTNPGQGSKSDFENYYIKNIQFAANI